MGEAVFNGLSLVAEAVDLGILVYYRGGVAVEVSLEVHVHIFRAILFEGSVQMDFTLHPLYLGALLFGLYYHLSHVSPIYVPVVLQADLHQTALLLPLRKALRQKVSC